MLFLISCGLVEQAPESLSKPQEDLACTEAVPGYESHQERSQGFYEPKETALVLDVFRDNWIRNFGHDEQALDDTLNGLCIIWKDEILSLTTPAGEEMYLLGYNTIEKTWVYIGDVEERKIYKTALVHEIVHSALYYHNGDGDRDHAGRDYYGWSSLHNEFIRDTIEEIESRLDGEYESR